MNYRFCIGKEIKMIKENRTIIEVTNTYLKVLQIKMQKGKPFLSNLDIIETSNRTEQQVINLLSQVSIKVKNTIVVIPKRYVILKQFSMPSQDEQEIHKMLSLKILQQVPFTQEEIVYDHYILEKLPDGYTKVLSAISPIEQISACLKPLEGAGLTVSNVFISSFGIAGWFSQFTEEKNPLGILNLDYDDAELCFYYEGKFLFSRNFNAGLSDLRKDDLSDMLNQVELTLKAYQNEFPALNIEKIFIATDFTQIETLSKGIVERFNIPVEIIRPSEKIPCELQVLSLIKNYSMVSLIGAWGFVNAGTEHQIDLVPRVAQNSNEPQFAINHLLKFLLSLSVLLALIVFALRFETYQKYVYLQSLEKRIDAIQEKSKEEEKKLDNIRKIQSISHPQVPLTDILRDIYQATPSEIYFRQISFDQDLTLRIDGIAGNQNILSSFQKRIQNLTWVKSVTLQKKNSQQYNNQGYLDFVILAQTNPSKQ